MIPSSPFLANAESQLISSVGRELRLKEVLYRLRAYGLVGLKHLMDVLKKLEEFLGRAPEVLGISFLSVSDKELISLELYFINPPFLD